MSSLPFMFYLSNATFSFLSPRLDMSRILGEARSYKLPNVWIWYLASFAFVISWARLVLACFGNLLNIFSPIQTSTQDDRRPIKRGLLAPLTDERSRENGRNIASIIILRDLNLADEDVQIQALEVWQKPLHLHKLLLIWAPSFYERSAFSPELRSIPRQKSSLSSLLKVVQGPPSWGILYVQNIRTFYGANLS